MGIFKNIFTWWEGATFGTWLNTRTNGNFVGEDDLGNRYFVARKMTEGRLRRWVVYNGSNDASRVPPDWHSWLHCSVDAVPDQSLPPMRKWQIPATGNLTGTTGAYRPSGVGPKRAPATGDYKAWSPEA
jgi:NADH:ubiquinone oxidoreductase subunit